MEMKRQTRTLKSTMKELVYGIYASIFEEEIDWEILVMVFSVIAAILVGVGLGVGFFKFLTGLVG